MVTRKPLPGRQDSLSNRQQPLPYPTTPTSPPPDASGFLMRPNERTEELTYRSSGAAQPDSLRAGSSSAAPFHPSPPAPVPSSSDISEGWVDGSTDPDEAQQQQSQLQPQNLPLSLQVAGGKKSNESLNTASNLPPTLRPGQEESTPRTSFDSTRSFEKVPTNPEFETKLAPIEPFKAPLDDPRLAIRPNNPFYHGNSADRVPRLQDAAAESSTNIWAELASDPSPPVETKKSPFDPQNLDGFSKLSLSSEPGNVKGKDPAVLVPEDTRPGHETPLISFEDVDANEKILPVPSATSRAPPTQSVPEVDSKVPMSPTEKELPATPIHPQRQDSFPQPKLEKVTEDTRAVQGDDTASQVLEPSSGKASATTEEASSSHLPQQPRTEQSRANANKQKSETYQIKHIRWQDSRSAEIRTSPILIQNANGPCPLLALVNALSLSTPVGLTTALIETLRVREQVSLGLLLDAVFDELMSGRRGDAALKLPDISELYAFLVTLHTGMNVNPRFLPTRKPQQASLLDVIEAESTPSSAYDHRKVGGFEETKEMKLYSTFDIPLIHGWLPHHTHPAFSALERSANTYEDAQNLLFKEEDLEDKLQREGLIPEEQRLLEDVASVKYFLTSSATQLTGYGLDTINEALSPGSIAILFRNDHFSTLYKQPRSGQLLHLVTDMGYVTHDEVVWESLVDLSGEGSEFFSGDFRPVGHHQASQPDGVSQAFETSNSNNDSNGWTTVNRSSRKASDASRQAAAQQAASSAQKSDSESKPPGPSNTEQEDADLALAMHLQEEEEDARRRANLARRREDELSRKYLSSQVESQEASPSTAFDIIEANQGSSSRTIDDGSHSGGGNHRYRGGGHRRVKHRARNSSAPSPNLSNPAPTPSSSNPLSSSGAATTGTHQSSQVIRPLIPPRRADLPPVHREPAASADLDDEAPPTYEQAARSSPYVPPLGTAQSNSSVANNAPPSASPPPPALPPNRPSPYTATRSAVATGGRPRGQSAYAQNMAMLNIATNQAGRPTMPGTASGPRTPSSPVIAGDMPAPAPVARRRSAGVGGAGFGGEERREKDCVVM